MNIRLGNIQFNQIEEHLGYRLTESDREIWNKFHNDRADLLGMESSFHVFHLPTCITFKGDGAKEAILQMFTPEKLVNPVGEIQVYELK